MSKTLPQPIPTNLREQMLKRISTMSDQYVVELHAVRVRREMSDQAVNARTLPDSGMAFIERYQSVRV